MLDKLCLTKPSSAYAAQIEACRRTILAWGGVLENEAWYGDRGDFVQRYWVEVHPDER